VRRGIVSPTRMIQVLRTIPVPLGPLISKSITYRSPNRSWATGVALPLAAARSSATRNKSAFLAVNPSTAEKTRALCFPRGWCSARQYSVSFVRSTTAFSPPGNLIPENVPRLKAKPHEQKSRVSRLSTLGTPAENGRHYLRHRRSTFTSFDRLRSPCRVRGPAKSTKWMRDGPYLSLAISGQSSGR
jgi:hypothetical protein